MITPREQAMALRFAARRRLAALARGESGPYADLAAGRERSVPVLVVLSLLALGAAAAYGFFVGAPSPPVPSAGAVRTEAGDYFIIVDGVAHPALNETSAKLAADEIVDVDAATLGGTARGAPMGIAGAPDVLPTAATGAGAWSMCLTPDEPDRRVTVLTHSPASAGLPVSQAMLLSDTEGTLWLVTGAARHRIEADRLAALGISSSTAVGAPAELLSLIPEATPLDAAALDWQPDAVLARTTPAGTTYFAAVTAGLAPITPLAAALLSDVPPAQTSAESAGTAQVDLPADWPAEVPQALDLRSRAVCASWGAPRAGVLDQLPLAGASLVDEPTAAAAVVVPRGRVTIVRVPGDRADSYLLVADSGVAYPVADRTALGRLGFQPEQAKDVPTAVLSLLPRGPELSVEAARQTVVT